ncbi:hypothetical protein Taro_052227, partial [Colocasia esculenta]|nr:hypothetical protein [Colocasia esculenta]
MRYTTLLSGGQRRSAALAVCLLQPVLVQRESKVIQTNHKSPPTTC